MPRTLYIGQLEQVNTEGMALVTDSQDVRAVCDSIGRADGNRWGCLFVSAIDGELVSVLATETAVPWNNSPVFDISHWLIGGVS